MPITSAASAQAHHGRIDVTSEAHGGRTFRVTLPRYATSDLFFVILDQSRRPYL